MLPVSLEPWKGNENATGGCQLLWVAQRIGHRQLKAEDRKANSGKGRTCLRMGNERTVKKVVLGKWNTEATKEGKLRGETISYWRRLVREAVEDDNNLEESTRDRKSWKTFIRSRVNFIQDWEEKMSLIGRNDSKPVRTERTV